MDGRFTEEELEVLRAAARIVARSRSGAKAEAARVNGRLGGKKKGTPTSEETKRKISEALKARYATMRQEGLAVTGPLTHGGRKKGSKQSDEAKAKISAANKARWAEVKQQDPDAAARLGRLKPSEETRRKMSESQQRRRERERQAEENA